MRTNSPSGSELTSARSIFPVRMTSPSGVGILIEPYSFPSSKTISLPRGEKPPDSNCSLFSGSSYRQGVRASLQDRASGLNFFNMFGPFSTYSSVVCSPKPFFISLSVCFARKESCLRIAAHIFGIAVKDSSDVRPGEGRIRPLPCI